MAMTTADLGGFRGGFDRLFNVSACFFGAGFSDAELIALA
jgi:hypothetical protein